MLNFTVGPVQSNESVRSIGAENVPYFRTQEFSAIMLESEQLMLEFSKAPAGAKVVFMTGSGTASMEAAIINTLTSSDKALVVNGGNFGQRFVEMLELHRIPYDEIKLKPGKALSADKLAEFDGKGYTAFLVNIHETSTGVLYDGELIGNFCKKNNIFLIVDAISSFLADEVAMDNWGIDVLITGSQKALACPPGISIIVLSPKAISRVACLKCQCMYLDLKSHLKNMERGQTPFTPAVGTLLQVHCRLKEIKSNGGVEVETAKIAHLAEYFRARIAELPLEIVSESMSNAVTPLHPTTTSAYDIFTILKNKYGIWICPNGGEMQNTVFRVGHIGYLCEKDYDALINALINMKQRKLI